MSGPARRPADDVAETAGGPSPDVRVVRGRPSAEELAAALIVIRTLAVARTSDTGPGAGPAGARTAPGVPGIRPHRLTGLRGPLALPRGPGAWRRSGWL